MTNFKRVRSLPPISTVREIVDAVNALIRYGIQDTGPLKLGVTSVTTTTYTVADNDQFLRINTTTAGGNVTVTLPAIASSDGRELTIKKVSTDDFTVTIDGNSSETIDGATTRVLYEPYSALTIRCDASTGWDVLSWN